MRRSWSARGCRSWRRPRCWPRRWGSRWASCAGSRTRGGCPRGRTTCASRCRRRRAACGSSPRRCPGSRRRSTGCSKNVLEKVAVHDAAHGFRAGRSIVSNAKPHVGAAVVVNLDLKDFFPTVVYPRVKGFFVKLGLQRGHGHGARAAVHRAGCGRGGAGRAALLRGAGRPEAAAGRADLAGADEPAVPAARPAAQRARPRSWASRTRATRMT